MLDVYARFASDYLAIPVIKGEKTEGEKFPGAVSTYCIEAMMQDKKALQSGTSHFLGQNFAKASNIRYQNRAGEFDYAWTTSWGVSTRLMGALIMAHSDDNGLVLPPKIAPSHIAIVPIYKDDQEKAAVLDMANQIVEMFRGAMLDDIRIYTELDDRDLTSGERNWYWIKKGIPLRIEIGPRDVASQAVMLARRDQEPRDKKSVPLAELKEHAIQAMRDMQASIYQNAVAFREANTVRIDNATSSTAILPPKMPSSLRFMAVSRFLTGVARWPAKKRSKTI
jgi:prolyl-tRNA synthetase